MTSCQVFEQLCREDYNETVFHEISLSQFDSLASSLSNLSTSQEQLKKPVEAVSKQLDNTTTSNARNISTRGRGTSRGSFRGRIIGRGRYQSRRFWQNGGNFKNNYSPENSNWPNNSTLNNRYNPYNYNFLQQQKDQAQRNSSSFTQPWYPQDKATTVSPPI